MGQALSYIPAQYKKEMAATRSSGQNKNKSDKENVKSTKKSQSRKQTKETDDSSSGSKEHIDVRTQKTKDETEDFNGSSDNKTAKKKKDINNVKKTFNTRKNNHENCKANTGSNTIEDTFDSKNDDSDEESHSDKENEIMDNKENDGDWCPDENNSPSSKVVPTIKRKGRKPFSELITVVPEEQELSEYEKLRLKRIAEQKAMLDAMKKSSKSLSNAILPKPNPRKIVKSRSIHIVPTRKNPPILRSRRLATDSTKSSEDGETDSFVYLPAKREYDMYSDSEDEEFRPKKRSKAQRKRDTEPLTEEQRKNLKAFDMEEFEEFLRTVPHGRKGVPISQANARTVIRQVKLMVSGAGVGYHHWPSDIFWRKGQPVTLEEDFDVLKEEAIQMENDYGRDLGNGWLLAHPLQKLQNFQNYQYAKQNQ